MVDDRRIKWVVDAAVLTERNFLPDKRRETSVFRIVKMPQPEVKVLGQVEFADRQSPKKTLLGWGEFPVSALSSDGSPLILDTSEDPEFPMHPRHAAVRGWPSGDDDIAKAREKSIAQQLARVAKAVILYTRSEIQQMKRSQTNL